MHARLVSDAHRTVDIVGWSRAEAKRGGEVMWSDEYTLASSADGAATREGGGGLRTSSRPLPLRRAEREDLAWGQSFFGCPLGGSSERLRRDREQERLDRGRRLEVFLGIRPPAASPVRFSGSHCRFARIIRSCCPASRGVALVSAFSISSALVSCLFWLWWGAYISDRLFADLEWRWWQR